MIMLKLIAILFDRMVIHEYTSYDTAEDLINTLVSGLPPGSVLPVLKWVNGVLLSFRAMPIN
ncbi:MAG: hypothetical protein ACFFBK_06205, partial [Promethearchaeota archaeon]